MELVRKNPIFFTFVFILLGASLGGFWYLLRLSGELSALKSSYQTKASQYDRYIEARPSPTRSNLEAIDSNYSELFEVYERSMSILNLNTYDREAFFGRTPVSRADWSFELHKFKENARFAALSNSVGLPSEVEFGFANYSDGGPPIENREAVHQQIVIVSSLLETLFDSGIESFVAVQRGVKPTDRKPIAAGRRPANSLVGEGDFFVVEPGESIAEPGTIDSMVFRLAFRGQSIALRGFLNRIANSPLPFVVRAVEAGLSSESGEKKGLGALAENPFDKAFAEASAVPIISNNMSLFVVTVEFLQLSVEVEKPSDSEAPGGGDNA